MEWYKAEQKHPFYYLHPDASSLTIDTRVEDSKFLLIDNAEKQVLGVYETLKTAQVMYLMLRHQYMRED